MPRRKGGEKGTPSLIELTPKELADQIGADTKVRVSKAHLVEIQTNKARETVESRLKMPKRRGR